MRIFSISRIVFALAVGVLFTSSNHAQADDIVRIEEDWELVLGIPDPGTVSPQATCTFSPTGDLNSFYAVFDVNLRNFPSYEAGGVQLQLWNGDASVEAVRDKAGLSLRTDGETVTWTQRIAVGDGALQFAVVNGNSETWGSFGTTTSITITVPSDLQNLNQYTPELSVNNSGIGFGGNRVGSLTLVRVRAYSNDRLLGQDDTQRVIFPR